MATDTELQHYSDEDNIGNYQWVTFNDFIAELEIMAADSDSYIHNTRRSQFINVAKQGIKLLQKTVKKEIKAIEFTVPKTLLFPYPQDYVNWVSLNLIYEGQLLPVFINKGINTAQRLELKTPEPTAYSDVDYFVYDVNGNIIKTPTKNRTNESECLKVQSKPHNKMQTQGQAVFNDLQSRISFGSDMEGMSVVLEYYSDGLFAWSMTEQERQLRGLKPIRIHKELKEVLIKYVYQEIIGYRRNVPANEKQRAKQEYKTYLHQAKLDRLGLNLYTVSKMIRGSSSSHSNNQTINPIIYKIFNNKFNNKFK